MWKKYPDLEPIRRLRYEGRELLGREIYFTEKRDGENVSLWLDNHLEPRISSRNLATASKDIQERMKSTPEYERAIELLFDEREYGNNAILYGELLKHVSPTRIEPKRKHIHWILFDIYDVGAGRFRSYPYISMQGKHFRIPVVRTVDVVAPSSMEELEMAVENCLKWCRRHHREGVVGKTYTGDQVFFKEKIDLPKLPKLPKKRRAPQYPPMPEERILRALQHAFDEVGEENWGNKAIAMPVVAKHVSIEATEHLYSRPKNIYWWYVNTPIEKLKP